MRIALASLVLAFLALGCGSNPPPTSLPTPTPTPASSLLPLPANLTGIPGPAEFTAEVQSQSPEGELTVGEPRDFTLGHCGLSSPIDIDGSLWDPIGGHNGNGGPLTELQQSELINATLTVIVLGDTTTMEMRTAGGAVTVLARHQGPRRYFLCA